MQVDRAGPDDLAALVRMRCLLWPGPTEEHHEELAALLERPTHAAFIATRDGRAIGFAEATRREYVDGADPGHVAYLEGLWTDEGERRRGSASALLAAVEVWATEQGCDFIGSDADIDNPEGLGWHAALGFEEVGRTVNFVRPMSRAGDTR